MLVDDFHKFVHTSLDYDMCLSSYTVYFLAVGPSGCCSCCALVRPRPRGRKCHVVLALTPMYVFSPRISLHLLGSTGQSAPDSYPASKVLHLFFLRPAQFHRLSECALQITYAQSEHKSSPSHSLRNSATFQMGSSGPKPSQSMPNAEAIIQKSDATNGERQFAATRGMSSFPWESRGENQHKALTAT